jgi:serine/threonine-protein kinase
MPAGQEINPDLVAYQLDAWMPDIVATHKLRGFVEDVGGEVLESVPGKIRVRLGERGSVYFVPGSGPLSWLGLGTRAGIIDMELLLQRGENQTGQIRITALMRSTHCKGAPSESFRERCGQVFCDLRAYLMGQGLGVGNS